MSVSENDIGKALCCAGNADKANKLVTDVETASLAIKHLEGWSKFRRLVVAEYDAQCRKLAASHDDDSSEGGVSNFPHLKAVWDMVKHMNTTAILKNISSTTHGRICVDVVAVFDERHVWIKCIARAGGENRELEDIAWAWLEVARQLPIQGMEPLVCFRFFAGAPKALCARLISMGVDAGEGFADPNLKVPAPVRSVNLDSTTLIALISNLSHGHVSWTFQDAALEEQAAQESTTSVLVQLAKTLSGKRLYCIPNVLATFKSIVDTIAGPAEFARASRLLSVVSELKASPLAGIAPSRSISARMLEIVGASVEHGMPTVTANGKAARALASQAKGIHTIEHMARALTEKKEGHFAKECTRQHSLPPQEASRLFEAILGCDEEHGEMISEMHTTKESADAIADKKNTSDSDILADMGIAEVSKDIKCTHIIADAEDTTFASSLGESHPGIQALKKQKTTNS